LNLTNNNMPSTLSPPLTAAIPIPSTLSQIRNDPFTTAALDTDVIVWRQYTAARPSPPESFFRRILAYHQQHSGTTTATVPSPPSLVHEAGTGPGNISFFLLQHNLARHIVASDVNERALAAAQALTPAELQSRVTFIRAPAEDLLSTSPGVGDTDLVLAPEVMPLLDAPRALEAFHGLLKPMGTLAVYFYGRPIFVASSSNGRTGAGGVPGGEEEARSKECDMRYERLAVAIGRLNLPIKGTRSFHFYDRAAEAIASGLDSVAVPGEMWEGVERWKWNADRPMLFAGPKALDFEVRMVDRRAEGEVVREVEDREFWADEWDVQRVVDFLATIHPNWKDKAGEKDVSEVEGLADDLRMAMGGEGVRWKVTFPVSLILATRK
jgi:trans-aconitate 3-methyltransferase